MHIEFGSFSFKKEIWFLQTHLKLSEMKSLNIKFYNSNFNNVTIQSLLEKIILKKDRLCQLLQSYENFSSNHSNSIKFMIKEELQFLMNKKIHDHAPLALQYLGEKNILSKPLVAIIGSRKPTFYGREQAYRFSKALSALGCAIISGGAIGIDSIANSVALEQGGGSCAILGSGLKNLYPPSNAMLFQNMKSSENGLILSEFSEYEPPQKWNFPKRNHTIALLADFVLVIEATFTSGSLITANAALDYGTDVGALPGCVDCVNSSGTNALIQKGAFCIQNPQDVFERVEYIYKQRVSSSYESKF